MISVFRGLLLSIDNSTYGFGLKMPLFLNDACSTENGEKKQEKSHLKIFGQFHKFKWHCVQTNI